eukprot:8111931-Alexandrium_andersonii.AAC.1
MQGADSSIRNAARILVALKAAMRDAGVPLVPTAMSALQLCYGQNGNPEHDVWIQVLTHYSQV